MTGETTCPQNVPHVYLSTGCLHGRHDYCSACTGLIAEKQPAKCKFCDAKCICPCHGQAPSRSDDS